MLAPKESEKVSSDESTILIFWCGLKILAGDDEVHSKSEHYLKGPDAILVEQLHT